MSNIRKIIQDRHTINGENIISSLDYFTFKIVYKFCNMYFHPIRVLSRLDKQLTI